MQPDVTEVDVVEVDAAKATEALIGQWHKAIEAAEDKQKDSRKDWDEARMLASTGLDKDLRRARKNGELVVSTNLIQGTKQSLLPELYARDPDISGRPAEKVSEADYRDIKGFAKTWELVVSHYLKSGNRLKRAMKRALRAQMDTGYSWVKLTWSDEREDNPIVAEQIKTIKTEMSRMQALAKDAAEQDCETDARVAELEAMVKNLTPQLERVKYRGLNIERVLCDCILIDPAVDELQDYRQARWLGQVIWMPADRAQEEFGIDRETLDKAHTYAEPGDEHKGEISEKWGAVDKDVDRYLKVVEIWSRQDGLVYTTIMGLKEQWAREPYEPVTPTFGGAWYPLFLLATMWVEGVREPLSLVGLLKHLQLEFVSRRTKSAVHRARATPTRAFNKSDVDPDTAQALSEGEALENIPFNLPPGADVGNAFRVIPYPAIDPALEDTSAVRSDIDMVSGVADQNRGATPENRTATQSTILQQGFTSRLSDPVDEIADLLEEMAMYAGGILRKVLTLEEVQAIAGSGAVWPVFDNSIDQQVKLQIDAGTMGKPDTQAQQKAWTAALPYLIQLGQMVVGADAQGNEPLKQALRTILKETFNRFGLRVDVDDFLPPSGNMGMQPGMPGQPMPPVQPMQQPAMALVPQ